MEYGKKYQHCKGGIYEFLSIVLPLQGKNGRIDSIQAFHTEEEKEYIAHQDRSGYWYSESGETLVLYKSLQDQNHYLRPVDLFFGPTEKDGKMVQRFKSL